jgi:hypothetical protein
MDPYRQKRRQFFINYLSSLGKEDREAAYYNDIIRGRVLEEAEPESAILTPARASVGGQPVQVRRPTPNLLTSGGVVGDVEAAKAARAAFEARNRATAGAYGLRPFANATGTERIAPTAEDLEQNASMSIIPSIRGGLLRRAMIQRQKEAIEGARTYEAGEAQKVREAAAAEAQKAREAADAEAQKAREAAAKAREAADAEAQKAREAAATEAQKVREAAATEAEKERAAAGAEAEKGRVFQKEVAGMEPKVIEGGDVSKAVVTPGGQVTVLPGAARGGLLERLPDGSWMTQDASGKISIHAAGRGGSERAAYLRKQVEADPFSVTGVRAAVELEAMAADERGEKVEVNPALEPLMQEIVQAQAEVDELALRKESQMLPGLHRGTVNARLRAETKLKQLQRKLDAMPKVTPVKAKGKPTPAGLLRDKGEPETPPVPDAVRNPRVDDPADPAYWIILAADGKWYPAKSKK